VPSWVNVNSSKELSFTIKNNGNAALNVANIIPPNGYKVSWKSGSISANSSQVVKVTFTPSSSGTYNGYIVIYSNVNMQEVSVSGTGIQAPTFTPAYQTYTACSSANITGTGNCAGRTYLGSTIQATASLYNYYSNTITFKVKRCSGNFAHSGTLYVKNGDYCGNVLSSKTYGVGTGEITVTVTPPTRSGTYSYTFVIQSATTDWYYSQTLSVKY
jgi:hypothetical protein